MKYGSIVVALVLAVTIGSTLAVAGAPPPGSEDGSELAGQSLDSVGDGTSSVTESVVDPSASALDSAGVTPGPDPERSVGVDPSTFAATSGAGGADEGSSAATPIDAEITSQPTYVGDRLVVGTDRGIYVFADGALETVVDTGSVRSIGQVDGDLAVVLVADRHFENVKGVDLSSGEVVWSTARERSVYSQDVGYHDRQVPAFDSEPIGDVDGDGTGDVAVSAGAAILAVSGETGDIIWEHEHQRNVWELATVDGSLFAGTQSGHLLALDPASGDLEFSNRLTEPFEGSGGSVSEVPRSVWSVEPVTVGGADRVAVTTEDGAVSLVDPADGTTEWRTDLLTFDDDLLERYYRSGDRDGTPTAPGDSLYFNLEATVVERGGEAKLAVKALVEERPSDRRYETPTAKLHLLDAQSGDKEWTTDDLGLQSVGSVVSTPDVEDGNFLLPKPPQGNTQEITVVDVSDGTTAESITVEVVPGTAQNQRRTGTGYLATNGEDLAVTATKGDLSVVDSSGALQWSHPVVTTVEVAATADFTGDGTEDYLLTAPAAVDRETQSRSLQVRSGVDGSIVWSVVLDASAINETGGYAMVRAVERADGADVSAVRQHPGRDRSGGFIVVRSGDDGDLQGAYEIVDNDEPLRLASAEPVGDVTGNGNQDAIVGDRSGVLLLDLDEGSIVWERYYDERAVRDSSQQECDRIERELDGDLSDERRAELEAEYERLDCDASTDLSNRVWNPFDEPRQIQYRAVRDDGSAVDLVALQPQSGGIAVVSIDSAGGEVSIDTVRQTSIDGNIRGETIRNLGDVTGDGYDELLLEVHRDDQPEGVIFSPAAGEIVHTLSEPRGITLATNEVGFTGDGTPGMVTYTHGDRVTVRAYAGVDRVWNHQMMRPPLSTALMPAAPAGDVDGDGSEELALVESNERDGSGARVRFFDVQGSDSVTTIPLEAWESGVGDPRPGVYAERIPDRTGDGQPELGAVAATGSDFEEDVGFFVIDPSEEAVLVSGEGDPSRFLALENGVGVVDDGSVTAVDVTEGVTLQEPQVGSPVHIEWTFDAGSEYVTTVVVDERPAAITDDQSVSLDLPPGTHRIEVRATGPDGVAVHDTTTVTVEGGSIVDIALYGATALSILVLFALGGTRGLLGRIRR